MISLNGISDQKDMREGLTKVELSTVAAAFNVILWIGLVAFPFIQVRLYTYLQHVLHMCMHVTCAGFQSD